MHLRIHLTLHMAYRNAADIIAFARLPVSPPPFPFAQLSHSRCTQVAEQQQIALLGSCQVLAHAHAIHVPGLRHPVTGTTTTAKRKPLIAVHQHPGGSS